MFFLDVLESAGQRRSRELEETRRVKAREMAAVPWRRDLPFQPSLKIKGSEYGQPSLFNVRPSGINDIDPNTTDDAEKLAVSPDGSWVYRERMLPAGMTLETASGNKRGVVCFDSDVKIPMLHQGHRYHKGTIWDRLPIMSFTPFEFFSLRPGVRLARGRVVVAGLGMGYQLERVCEKSNVKHVTLVEKSQELVDWILPRIDLHGKSIKVVVGDAYSVVPSLSYDVALVDVFKNYGGNRRVWDTRTKLEHRTSGADRGGPSNPGKLWVWGA